MGRKRGLGLKKEEKVAYSFISVPVILLILFLIIPIIMALGISFTDYDVINSPKFIGLENYKRLINDEFFWTALKNTVVYTLLYVPLGMIVSLGTALLLNRNKKIAGIFRTFFYVPVLASTVATATLWYWILNPQYGLLNKALEIFGIQGPAWLYDSKLAMISIIIMSVWAGFGTNMMIFLAGLKGISIDVYEAARLEGANRWQIFRNITWPALSKTTFLVSTMLIISAFQVFDQAFVLTKGGPGNATITLVYYIYNNGFKNLDMGYASSISFILFFIILIFSIINAKVSNSED